MCIKNGALHAVHNNNVSNLMDFCHIYPEILRTRCNNFVIHQFQTIQLMLHFHNSHNVLSFIQLTYKSRQTNLKKPNTRKTRKNLQNQHLSVISSVVLQMYTEQRSEHMDPHTSK